MDMKEIFHQTLLLSRRSRLSVLANQRGIHRIVATMWHTGRGGHTGECYSIQAQTQWTQIGITKWNSAKPKRQPFFRLSTKAEG